MISLSNRWHLTIKLHYLLTQYIQWAWQLGLYLVQLKLSKIIWRQRGGTTIRTFTWTVITQHSVTQIVNNVRQIQYWHYALRCRIRQNRSIEDCIQKNLRRFKYHVHRASGLSQGYMLLTKPALHNAHRCRIYGNVLCYRLTYSNIYNIQTSGELTP